MSEFIKLKTSMSYYGLMYARIEEMMSDPWELGCKGIIRKERLEEALSAIRNGTFTRANPRKLYFTENKVYLTDILKVAESKILETWSYEEGVPKEEINMLFGGSGANAEIVLPFEDRQRLPTPDKIDEGSTGLFEGSSKAPRGIPVVELKIKKVRGELSIEIIDAEQPAKEEELSPREKALANYIIEEIIKRMKAA